MKARSKAQQRAAGAALSARRGEATKGDLRGAAREMHDTMTEDQLRDLAGTRRKDRPERS